MAAPPSTRPPGEVPASIFFLLPFLFYLVTMAPTIGLGDTALLLDSIQHLRITTHVNNHSLTIIAAWLVDQLPIGTLAWRGNLTSVLIGAVSVAIFYRALLVAPILPAGLDPDLARRARGLVAVIGATLLMVSHSMWWHSTLIECYAFNALFTALAILCLAHHAASRESRWLVALFGVCGLAVFNHVQLGFLGVGAGVALITEFRRHRRVMVGLFLQCTIAFIIGWLPWLVTFGFDWAATGSFVTTLRGAFVGSFESIMLKGSWSYGVREFLFLVFQQLPSPALLLVPIGTVMAVWRHRREPMVAGLVTVFLVNTYFFLFYNTWDRFAFLLPSFIILIFAAAWALGWLTARALERGRGTVTVLGVVWLASLLLPVWFYSRLSQWGDTPGSRWFARFNNAHTHNTHRVHEYIANPDKRTFTDVDDFTRALAAKLPRRAIFVDDDSRTYYPLEFYQRFEGFRPDVTLVLLNSWGFEQWGASTAEFARLLERAVAADLDLFLVSVLHPFHAFLSEAAKRGRTFEFVRFPLDEQRWVYRLKTQRDYDAGSRPTAALPLLTRDRLVAGIDLHSSDVLIFRSGRLTDQEMGQFGQGWRDSDHLFTGFDRVGSALEFMIESPQADAGALEVQFTAAPDFGQVTLLMNDQPVQEIDLYAPAVMPRMIRIPAWTLPAGRSRLTITVTGRSPPSTGFGAALDTIRFVPTAAAVTDPPAP